MGITRLVIPLLVTLSIAGYVQSSCDLIGLKNCECKYPRAKRYEIECQNAGLGSLPGKVNYTLPEGDASGNFSYNSISSIPDFYFVFMKHFDILDFTSNSISSFGKNSLTGLETRLTNLNLSWNRIKSIPIMALREYIRLNNLDLSRNQISSACQIHTADVITYSLAYNGIKSLGDQCFSESTRVQQLDLSGNKISSISSEAFEGMNALKSLNLASNKLSDLKNGLQSLISLPSFESLSLRGNQFEYLASVCPFVMPRIKFIDFGYNNLLDIQKYCFTSYSTAAQGSSELTLNFEHNKVKALAGSAFAGLSSRLTTLLLNHNRIADVNVNSFKDLVKLITLNLDNNQINSLEFLRNWDDNTLQDLSIANNLIRDLSPGVFGKMLKLTKLSLDGNLLLSIESSAFQGMVVLDDLSIKYNLLTNLADGAFSGLGQLKKLALSGNALVTLKNCTFASLDRLIQFHFEDNMLHCDCDLLWLLKFITTVNGKGVPDESIAEPVLEDFCHYPDASYHMYMVNVVSSSCPKDPSNACFGLHVTYEESVAEAAENSLNVSWSWDRSSASNGISSIQLTQVDIETNELVHNQTVTSTPMPIALPLVQDEKIYKICVSMTLPDGRKEYDCTAWPMIIKKPTTTMAPTTEVMTTESGMDSGSIAAIILGIILIILIILIVLFVVYLVKTRKHRLLMPGRRYAGTAISVEEESPDSSERSPSSNGKPDPLDFRAAGEEDPMMITARPGYEEHDL